MELNLRDRFVFIQMLPQTGKLKDIKLAKDLNVKLLPTAKEIEEYGITQDNSTGFIQWNSEVPNETTIDITEDEIELIKKQLRVLDKNEQMDSYHLDIIDRLFEGVL